MKHKNLLVKKINEKIIPDEKTIAAAINQDKAAETTALPDSINTLIF